LPLVEHVPKLPGKKATSFCARAGADDVSVCTFWEQQLRIGHPDWVFYPRQVDLSQLQSALLGAHNRHINEKVEPFLETPEGLKDLVGFVAFIQKHRNPLSPGYHEMVRCLSVTLQKMDPKTVRSYTYYDRQSVKTNDFFRMSVNSFFDQHLQCQRVSERAFWTSSMTIFNKSALHLERVEPGKPSRISFGSLRQMRCQLFAFINEHNG
jgi:hypothetical protein